MSERVDFSANASVYDCRHGAAISGDELERVWTRAGIFDGSRVLDIGSGTGRVSIPLAARGCSVVAVEPAQAMLAKMRHKDVAKRVTPLVAEGARLPFCSAAFDFVVIARLLYLTPDWRAILAEARRVLNVGGRLLHEWGNGGPDEEWVQIREELRRRFDEAGLPAAFHPGVRTASAIERELDELRLVREDPIDTGPGPTLTLREFLRRVTTGELSYIWNVPEDVRASCLPKLREWAERQFDLDRPISMPRELRWTIHRRDAG